MDNFLERNRNFLAITIGAVIIGSCVYFGLKDRGINSESTKVIATSDVAITKKVVADVADTASIVSANAFANAGLSGNEGKEKNILSQEPAAEEKKEISEEKTYLVTRVIDGDTIELENGNVVRYVGIDTPEKVHPSKPVQCFGKEASSKNKELVEGKRVKLEKDISETDKYGRLLRYVWVGGIFVNDYLVRQGYGYVYTYPPDVKYSEQFVQAQQEARENNRGLWAGCLEQEAIKETFSSSVESTAPKEGTICSYNAYNRSDFFTHVEAQSVFNSCGGVNNDVHRLDSDKDGLACESLP